MIVLMTSLVSRRARSHPQMPPHTAPPAAPTAIISVIASGRGHPPRYGPTAPAAIAPMTSWPSAPMFHSAAENETEIASPVKISGVARTTVSVSAYQLPKAPCASAAITPSGEAPSASSAPAIIAIASASAAIARIMGEAITAQGSCPSAQRGAASVPLPRHQHSKCLGIAFVAGGLPHPPAADHVKPSAHPDKFIEIA